MSPRNSPYPESVSTYWASRQFIARLSVCAPGLIYMVCARVGRGREGGGCVGEFTTRSVYNIYILYSTHTGLTHACGSQMHLALAHCGILDVGWHTDFGWPRCGCAFWLHFISVYFHFGFHFLVASSSLLFFASSLLVVGGEKVLLLQWQKRYENAFSDFAQLQLLHSSFLLQPEFFLGFSHCFSLPFFPFLFFAF